MKNAHYSVLESKVILSNCVLSNQQSKTQKYSIYYHKLTKKCIKSSRSENLELGNIWHFRLKMTETIHQLA